MFLYFSYMSFLFLRRTRKLETLLHLERKRKAMNSMWIRSYFMVETTKSKNSLDIALNVQRLKQVRSLRWLDNKQRQSHSKTKLVRQWLLRLRRVLSHKWMRCNSVETMQVHCNSNCSSKYSNNKRRSSSNSSKALKKWKLSRWI